MPAHLPRFRLLVSPRGAGIRCACRSLRATIRQRDVHRDGGAAVKVGFRPAAVADDVELRLLPASGQVDDTILARRFIGLRSDVHDQRIQTTFRGCARYFESLELGDYFLGSVTAALFL